MIVFVRDEVARALELKTLASLGFRQEGFDIAVHNLQGFGIHVLQEFTRTVLEGILLREKLIIEPELRSDAA